MSRFWRNLALVGLLHVAGLMGLAHWSKTARPPLKADVVWMEGSASASDSAQLPTEAAGTPAAGESDEGAIPEQEQMAPAEVSDLPLATPTPTASLRLAPTPRVAPKSTPKPTPRKMALAKDSPKRSALKKRETSSTQSKNTTARPSAVVVAGSSGGEANGAGSATQFVRYGSMLHDRFFGGWDQPMSVVATGAKMSTLVRIRIEKDGRVSDFSLVRPSGNIVVDESVEAIAKRVTQVDPLPAGLGNGGHYDVNINFELNAE